MDRYGVGWKVMYRMLPYLKLLYNPIILGSGGTVSTKRNHGAAKNENGIRRHRLGCYS